MKKGEQEVSIEDMSIVENCAKLHKEHQCHPNITLSEKTPGRCLVSHLLNGQTGKLLASRVGIG